MKFHRLTLIEDMGIINGNRQWKMRCDCGQEKIARASYIRIGHIKSCGCLHIERNKGPKYFRHGLCNTPTYRSWNSMKFRCNNPSKKYYFGKVSVCKRWLDFRNFLIDMGERPKGKTLDRKDGLKGYYPGNCRWATHTEQARNKSNSRLISFRGKRKTLSEWAEDIGIGHATIAARIKRGWSIKRSLTAPLG